jgi:hypothetical protein
MEDVRMAIVGFMFDEREEVTENESWTIPSISYSIKNCESVASHVVAYRDSSKWKKQDAPLYSTHIPP